MYIKLKQLNTNEVIKIDPEFLEIHVCTLELITSTGFYMLYFYAIITFQKQYLAK